MPVAEFGAEESRGDRARKEDHRQTAARVRAAADEPDAFERRQLVARTAMEHLSVRVREIERGAMVDALGAPVERRDDALHFDAPAQVADAEDALELIERRLSQARGFGAPVDLREARLRVRHGDKDVERRRTARGERRIGRRRVAAVHRRVG